MARTILVIDPDLQSIGVTKRVLRQEGFKVATALKGDEGIEKVDDVDPDLIMIDMMLSDMEYGPGPGWSEVARRLSDDPDSKHIPIVILATRDKLDDLVIGPGSPADDFLIKPFSPSELVTKILPLLGTVEEARKNVVSTGNSELDSKMGGGIPVGSLTLIEGTSGAGKSVLVQQMIWGSLKEEFVLSCFTSENSIKSLIKQMRSLSLDVLNHLLLNKFAIFPMELARLGKKAPRVLLQAMRKEAADADPRIRNQLRRDMIFVDSLTSAISSSSVNEVLTFFEGCKRLCGGGVTILLVIHSHAMSRELLVRIRSLCDAHLQLRTEEVRGKLLKTLEVTKVRGADKGTGNILSFEVEPGWGMRLIPISKVKG